MISKRRPHAETHWGAPSVLCETAAMPPLVVINGSRRAGPQ